MTHLCDDRVTVYFLISSHSTLVTDVTLRSCTTLTLSLHLCGFGFGRRDLVNWVREGFSDKCLLAVPRDVGLQRRLKKSSDTLGVLSPKSE